MAAGWRGAREKDRLWPLAASAVGPPRRDSRYSPEYNELEPVLIEFVFLFFFSIYFANEPRIHVYEYIRVQIF